MKKNILKATLVAAFGLIAGFNVYNSQKSDVMSDLALANVEALASGEEGIGKGLLYGTEPDENNQCHYCCCPGDNDCGAAACSGSPDLPTLPLSLDCGDWCDTLPVV